MLELGWFRMNRSRDFYVALQRKLKLAATDFLKTPYRQKVRELLPAPA